MIYTEAAKARKRRSYLRHRDAYIERGRRWQLLNKDKYKKYLTQWRRKYRSKNNIGMGQNKQWFLGAKCWINLDKRILYRNAREELFHTLGQYVCQKCGQHDKRVLQLDHINGGGTYERDILFGRGSPQYYMYYVLNPELARRTLQILCANCNVIKRFEGKPKNL